MIKLGKLRFAFLSAVLASGAGFFALPLGALVRAVGKFGNLVTAWRSCEYELLGTLRVTPLAASICVVMATLAAWLLARADLRSWIAGAGLLLLISMPAPIVGIGLIKLLNHRGLSGIIYDSQGGLILAYVIRTLPFATLAILPSMKRIPGELEEAVTLEGGNWLRQMVSVVIPSNWQAIVMAWLLAFILALSEMGASFLVAPPGRATLSIRFFTLIHYGVYPDAAGICLILLLIVALSASGIALILWPMIKRRLP